MEELKNCKDTVSLIRAYALYRPLLRKEDILSLRCFSDTTISLPIARVILGDYFYFAIKILQLFGWEGGEEKSDDGAVNIGGVSGVSGVYGWSGVEMVVKTWRQILEQ